MSNLGVTDKVVLGYLIGAVLAYTILYFLFLRRWFLVRKDYRRLRKQFDFDSALWTGVCFDDSYDAYLLANSAGIRIVNRAGTPLNVFLTYDEIECYSLTNISPMLGKPRYYKKDHILCIYLKQTNQLFDKTEITCIYTNFDDRVLFNKYATRKCDFHKYIAQYIQPKTATYTK